MQRDKAVALRRPPSIARVISERAAWGAIASLAMLALAGAAQAQSASSTLSAYKAGYGGTGLSGFESPVNVSTRDANGNLVITDGVIQAGSDNSIFSHVTVGGASDTYSGAGALGSATAIGNNLSVNVSGNNNMVIVNATQTNTGSISATTVLNGKVNLDGQ
jgi:holdfast attachment protein HfaA